MEQCVQDLILILWFYMVEIKSIDQEKDLKVNIYYMDFYEINVVICKMIYNIYIYIFMMIYKYISNIMYMYV